MYSVRKSVIKKSGKTGYKYIVKKDGFYSWGKEKNRILFDTEEEIPEFMEEYCSDSNPEYEIVCEYVCDSDCPECCDEEYEEEQLDTRSNAEKMRELLAEISETGLGVAVASGDPSDEDVRNVRTFVRGLKAMKEGEMPGFMEMLKYFNVGG